MEMAGALLAFVAERQLSSVRWSDLAAVLTPATRAADDDGRDDVEEWDDDDEVVPEEPATGLTRDRLLRSPLLLHSLADAAEATNPRAHHLLAALYRCERPNAYLYEESLKGRVLTTVERGWVDEYLRLESQFRKYEAHLKAAALAGARSAAVEYAAAFDSQAFFELAERLSGDVDADRMAAIAATPQSRARWLRTAAEQGSRSALEQLARAGDEWAEERLAESGDADCLRSAAERALTKGDALRAWTWQYLAMEHGVDLNQWTMAAYHDGGERDGQFYDSDFGGAMYADGNEALTLPQLGPVEHRDAQARAREIFGRTP